MFNISDDRLKASVMSMLREIQNQNVRYNTLFNSKGARIESLITKIIACFNPKKIKSIRGFALDKYSSVLIRFRTGSIKTERGNTDYEDDEYFLDNKIAVYTSIFGNYDTVHEPMIFPDNIDYYIVTDNDIKSNSHWKVRTVDLPSDLNSAQKNRYVKMHPHLVFPEYKYSIYVDGNISILSDLTPLVHRIGRYGFAMHRHSSRDDVFDELKAAYYTHRINKQQFKQCNKYLIDNKMPSHYGLVECNAIARDHENEISNLIMEQWWEMYGQLIKRDQICLAYVLYKNQIKMSEIATLGINIYNSPLLSVSKHS